MNRYFKIVAVIAVLALLPLQYFLLSNVYKSLEKNLYTTIDECFQSAVEEEAMIRFHNIAASRNVTLGGSSSRINQDVLLSVSSILQISGSSIDMDTLSSIFSGNLKEKELGSLNFKIEERENDTTLYKVADDFIKEPTGEQLSFSSLETHVVPVTQDLTKGLVAVVNNPYVAIFSKMKLMMIFSFIIVLFVIWCLYRFARLLSKANFINNLRKDHTYAMIHDMKTPLSSIMISAEDFKENEKIAEDAETAQQLKILDEECRHLNTICEKVINVAKVENKKLKFVYEKIVLDAFLSGIKSKYESLYSSAAKKVNIKVECKEGEWMIADRLYLTEIMDNLIDNSIKYSGSSVDIKLSVSDIRRFKEIRVLDNGKGFYKSEKKRLFKKFERGENTVGISGHGIGLHYVYQLMKFFDGYVKIESKVGEFTEVVLGFPSVENYEIVE